MAWFPFLHIRFNSDSNLTVKNHFNTVIKMENFHSSDDARICREWFWGEETKMYTIWFLVQWEGKITCVCLVSSMTRDGSQTTELFTDQQKEIQTIKIQFTDGCTIPIRCVWNTLYIKVGLDFGDVIGGFGFVDCCFDASSLALLAFSTYQETDHLITSGHEEKNVCSVSSCEGVL